MSEWYKDIFICNTSWKLKCLFFLFYSSHPLIIIFRCVVLLSLCHLIRNNSRVCHYNKHEIWIHNCAKLVYFFLKSSFQTLKFKVWQTSLIGSPDGGSSVSPQVPAQAPCGGSKRGWDRRHQPARKSPDFHLLRNAIHRCHSLPEYRCKTT